MTVSFDYPVKRQRRQTMALHVLSDATVEARVPKWVASRDVCSFVEGRADWVLQQRQLMLEKLALRPSYREGNLHPFLGMRLPLVLGQGRSRVDFIDEALHVRVRDISDVALVKASLDRWYRHQADWLFSERLEHCYQLFDGIEPVKPFPELRLRKMRSRWGSCSSRGVITLNTMLVQMPVECIDFVVTHELCHLWELNHSPRFYQLLNSVMPQWRLYEQRVEEWG